MYVFGGSKVEILDCDISGPVSEARGVICDSKSEVSISNSDIHDCQNAGIWATNQSICNANGCRISKCGGYGSLYATFGAKLEVRNSKQMQNMNGAGSFVLHE